MIERAIVQEIVRASDGTAIVREYARPSAVLEMAHRMRAWHSSPEGCTRCHAMNAVCVRRGLALCALCRDAMQRQLEPIEAAGRRVIRTTSGDNARGLIGHAIVVNQRSLDLGGFFEIILPEAIDRTIAEGLDVRALWNHDPSVILGRSSAGTLTFRKDLKGLAVTIEPPRWAGRYLETIERRDVTGMSFAFNALDDDWHLDNGDPIREVLDMRVREVSPVSFPAYPQTDVDVGSGIGKHSRQWWERWHKTQLAR